MGAHHRPTLPADRSNEAADRLGGHSCDGDRGVAATAALDLPADEWREELEVEAALHLAEEVSRATHEQQIVEVWLERLHGAGKGREVAAGVARPPKVDFIGPIFDEEQSG